MPTYRAEGDRPHPGITVTLDAEAFRTVIRATMEHRGLNPTRLAREAGLPPGRVHDFLNGKHPSAAVQFALLAWVYRETVGALARRDRPDPEEDAGDPDPLAA